MGYGRVADGRVWPLTGAQIGLGRAAGVTPVHASERVCDRSRPQG